MQQKSLIVIYNPNARKGKIKEVMPYILQRLSTKFSPCEAVQSKSAEDMVDLARKNAEKYDCIVVAGGDGSIHNVVNGVKLSKGRPTLGFLPYGTVNDVCRTLNIKKDLDKAIDVILRGETIKYDIMQEGNNFIIYTLAGGMFVSTSFKTSTGMKRVLGKLAYFITGAKQLFSMRTLPLTVEIDGERHHGRYIMAMVLNSASAAGFRINKERDIDDGLIDVILVEKKRSFFVALLTLLKMFLFGLNSVRKHKNVVIQKCKTVKVENHSNEPFTQDGEEADFLTKEIKISAPITVFYGVNKKD
ncbi:MAG: diacylglycerol kinase family lipid kinase [Clostridia bacterium]|nr:diacylglycerol kinase family lipid kinase [Clostridia bacterium]